MSVTIPLSRISPRITPITANTVVSGDESRQIAFAFIRVIRGHSI